MLGAEVLTRKRPVAGSAQAFWTFWVAMTACRAPPVNAEAMGSTQMMREVVVSQKADDQRDRFRNVKGSACVVKMAPKTCDKAT